MWHGDDADGDVPELETHPLVVALADERVDAAIRLARLAHDLGRPADVVPVLRRLTLRHPWHEALHARLVVALAAAGQQAAALEVYDGIRRRLAEELGIDPCRQLRDARQAVLCGQRDPLIRIRCLADTASGGAGRGGGWIAV
jgi:DNA-binding SARP family transcriptional activator